MPPLPSSSIKCQFTAKNWAEVPFHEHEGAGKLSNASIVNQFSGEIEGEGTLQYLMAYPSKVGNDVVFIGYERIEGLIGSRRGSFVIKHDGVFSFKAGVSGRLEIVVDSGTGDFTGIAGGGFITAKPGEHGGEYLFTITFPA